MSGADFWRIGYGHEFASNIGRIADSLERIADSLDPAIPFDPEPKILRALISTLAGAAARGATEGQLLEVAQGMLLKGRDDQAEPTPSGDADAET